MVALQNGDVRPERIDLRFINIDAPRAIFDRMGSIRPAALSNGGGSLDSRRSARDFGVDLSKIMFVPVGSGH